MASRWKKLVLVVSAIILLTATDSAKADHLFGFHRKPICTPFSDGCFGYYPNQWRAWPAECAMPGCKASESALSAPVVKEVQDKGEAPKTEEKKPAPKGETVPAPKEDRPTRGSKRGVTPDASPIIYPAANVSVFSTGARN